MTDKIKITEHDLAAFDAMCGGEFSVEKIREVTAKKLLGSRAKLEFALWLQEKVKPLGHDFWAQLWQEQTRTFRQASGPISALLALGMITQINEGEEIRMPTGGRRNYEGRGESRVWYRIEPMHPYWAVISSVWFMLRKADQVADDMMEEGQTAEAREVTADLVAMRDEILSMAT